MMYRSAAPAALLLLFLSLCVHADTVGERLQRLLGFGVQESSGDDILPPEEAFRFSAAADGAGSVRLEWDIVDGYYLYRDKFEFTVLDGAAAVNMPAVMVPRGQVKQDEVFGSVEVNTGMVEIIVPLLREPGPELPIVLRVGYQGCKEGSICYAPIRTDVPLTLARLDAGTVRAAAPPPQLSAEDGISRRLGNAGLLVNIAAFFGFGLLLALTPCIFPMIPILSGIIIGHGKPLTPMRGFALSLAYVLAMALTYAVLGVIAGSFRINLQAAAQAPWVIALFATVFVFLALSMFGLYQLQVPVAIQNRLRHLVEHQPEGSLRGAAVMGALSALIVGPCVAPPLAGALLYISQTGDALLGGLALFALGLGLGAPLLLLGASAGTLLPKAGAWMVVVRAVFGVVMLAVAVWLLGRILPGPITLLLWALLLMTTAIFMGALDPLGPEARWARLWKGIGLAMLVYGAALIVGAAGGGSDVLRPLQALTARSGGAETHGGLAFTPVRSLDQLQEELLRASRSGTPVMLDFYADWCVTCKEMERRTFPDPRVRDLLKDVVLLQADVTSNDAAARELLRAFELFGPPAILFFDGAARERRSHRLVGFIAADAFVEHLRDLLRS
jgi:thiol:disulfide interchange protein DsbD